MSDRRINIRVPVLARVEGEGALELNISNQQITRLQLKIFEPPRLFEKLLEGRHFSEVPDIVARICGICPVAYQMSAIHAFETLFHIDPGPWVRQMRRLFYCGEWLESHALHIHLLAAPDFFGYDSAPAMAKDYPDEIRRGLALQHIGNQILAFLGGRSVHPVGAKIGGFHHAPKQSDADALLQKLYDTLPLAEELITWVASFPLPDNEQAFTYVALRHPHDYPLNEGNILSSAGHNIAIADYAQHFIEHQEAHSTALYSLLDNQAYLVGPLARLNLNFDRLPNQVQTVLHSTGIRFPSQNMFHSVLARAGEIYFALQESIHQLEAYQAPKTPNVPVQPKAGMAYGCSEAPRGMLWHCYQVNEQGIIQQARIVPPTSQNQARMEQDLRQSIAELGLDKPEQQIRLHAEQVIRNYDPCISCATHFLDLRIHRQ